MADTMTAPPGFTFRGCTPERGNRGMRTRWEAHWTYARADGRVIGGVREITPFNTWNTSKEDAEAWAVDNITPEWGPVRMPR